MLYSLEQICKGCRHLVTHFCALCTDGPRFCHCEIDKDGNVDFTLDKCSFKSITDSEA